MPSKADARTIAITGSSGFSLIELMVSLTILLVVSGIVISGLIQMSYTQGTINNRSEMHASVRSATELMQQEIGQAGRIAIPAATTYTLATAVPGVGTSSTVVLNSSTSTWPGLYVPSSGTNYEQLVVGTGANQETVSVTAYNPTTHAITAIFNSLTGQPANAPVNILGAFPSGVVPSLNTTCSTASSNSTGCVLKLYGDINGDGNMVYVEYKCDIAAGATVGNLYRNSMAYDIATKQSYAASMILLPNIQRNPGGAPCFTYQEKTVGVDTYVVNVAVTLTVQTQNPDPQTKAYQAETKALLNVSPRNVFEAWELASAGITTRIQPMPPTVTALLPSPAGTY